ncbi:hypothetical protein [Tianweitania sediminis]|uniref:Uncharacterized protein n=1 Tax=Tianweitania sediminis TaxID=1502156 RepID=A0A8J7R425_9HYPH|nr:hypothetical protein [Tianweitania sediminis]MBP0440683.1 hypothetical protein [Tianweitania sediminis]
MGEMVTKAGFYDGKFRKAGQFHSGPQSDDIVMENGGEQPADLDKMTKDELVAEAGKRGVEVKASDTKADIIKSLESK